MSFSNHHQSAVAEGLWQFADEFEAEGNVPATVKCLEAICQSERSFLPLIEVKTRVRLASFLFDHTNNIAQARSHLERAQMLLKHVPGNLDLKCCVLSLLSHCYQALDSKNLRKQALQKGWELLSQAQDWEGAAPWLCNFQMQMAQASLQEGDPEGAVACASQALEQAQKMGHAPLQLLFAATILHIHMCASQDAKAMASAAEMCDQAWAIMTEPEREAYAGLSVYHRLLRAAHRLVLAEYDQAKPHLQDLDATLQSFQARQQSVNTPADTRVPGMTPSAPGAFPPSTSQAGNAQTFDLNDPPAGETAGPSNFSKSLDGPKAVRRKSLPLGPPPLDSEWLPLTAAEGLAALMWALHERPAGHFRKCLERLKPALDSCRGALLELGVTPSSTAQSVSVQAYWDAQPYLVLLQHLLEAKAGMELTQCDVREAQTTIAEALDWLARFPTHEALKSTVQVLIGQYVLTTGDFEAAVGHFKLAAMLTEDSDTKTHIAIQTALAHLSVDSDADKSAAVDLITPLVQERELARLRPRAHAAALFASSMLLAVQGEHLQARFQIGRGLKVTHKQLGNHQLVSQFLGMLGSVNRALSDLAVAADVLKSAFTLAKSQHDLVTQLSALREIAMTAGIQKNETRLVEATSQIQRRGADFQGRVQAALDSPLHALLLEYGLKHQ